MKIKDLDISKEIKNVIKDIAQSAAKMASILQDMDGSPSGLTGVKNIQGEEVHHVDDVANELFVNRLKRNKHVASIVSEEEVYEIKTGNKGAEYLVAIDPLDGSSNIDVNIPTGTIFGIYRKDGSSYSGKNLIAAGYVLYSCATEMVLGDGKQTVLYRLANKKFKKIRVLAEVQYNLKYVSYNSSNLDDAPVHARVIVNKANAMKLSGRYVGSLVADLHRNLQKGGVFLYPASKKNPFGKLRYLYECAPMALLSRGVGLDGYTGITGLLDISVQSIHDRKELIVVSEDFIAQVKSLRQVKYV